MKTVEIHIDGTNEEDIEARISRNINKRQIEGAYPEEEIEEIAKPLEGQYSLNEEAAPLYYLNSHWHLLNNNHIISSNIPVVGGFLVAGRKLLYGEMQRYVDPVFLKETEFNRNVVNILNEMYEKLDKIDALNMDFETEIKNYIDVRMEQIKKEILQEIHDEMTS